MACDCSVCKNRYIKEGAVTPVAMICDLTANDCKSVLILLNACDDNGRFLRSVMLNCDGTATLVGTFDLSLNPYTPVGVVNDCEEKDFEYLCDDTANVFVSLLDVTVTPHELKYYLPLPNGDLAPYTPTGTVRICGNPDYEVTTACYIDTTTDQEINRIQFWDTTEVPPVLVSTIWYNVSTGATIAAPTLTNLIPCSTSLMPQEEILCDDNGSFVRHFVYNPDGTINRTYDTTLAGITYTVVGTVVACSNSEVEEEILCDDNGSFIRHYTYNSDGSINTVYDTALDGVAYTVVGTVKQCVSIPQLESLILCDEHPIVCEVGNLITSADWVFTGAASLNGTNPYMGGGGSTVDGIATQIITVTPGNTYTYSFNVIKQGGGTGIARVKVEVLDNTTIIGNITLDGGQNHTFANIIPVTNQLTIRLTDLTTDGFDTDVEIQNNNLVCVTPANRTTQTQFIRQMCSTCGDTSTPTIVDYALDGITLYTVQGVIKLCGDDYDVEQVTLCDDNGTFIRHFIYNSDGSIVIFSDTTLSGTSYAPVGTITICSGSDIEQEILCDDNGPFIRHYIYNTDGTVNTTYNTTLNGVAYTVVGAIDICVKSNVPVIVCRCDDTDGDNIPDKTYKAIVQIDDVGATTVLANYEEDLLTPYTPIAPMLCSNTGTDLVSVLPNYTVLQGAGTWILHTDSAVLTQSVTVTVITVGNMADPPTLTTQAGVHPVYEGQTVTWSVVFQRDILGLKSPLTITSKAGDIIAIHWTEESI